MEASSANYTRFSILHDGKTELMVMDTEYNMPFCSPAFGIKIPKKGVPEKLKNYCENSTPPMTRGWQLTGVDSPTMTLMWPTRCSGLRLQLGP